jgi:ABC-type transporter Mla maintaining outer membrane lipid asymmetry permease subunit MlaE
MASALVHFGNRVRHIWIDNPIQLFAFKGPFGRSILAALDQLGSRAWKQTARRYGEQALKAVERGAIPIAMLAGALWFGGQRVGSGTGELGRRVIESFILVIAIRDALPLVVALFLAMRQGASLTTKFAYPQSGSPETKTEQMQLLTIAPSVLSSMVAGAVFLAALATATLGGYLRGGPLRDVQSVTTFAALTSGALRTSLLVGAAKATVFGGIIAYVALALGWQAGHEGSRLSSAGHYPYYQVWEAASISIGVCIALSLTSARYLEATLQ